MPKSGQAAGTALCERRIGQELRQAKDAGTAATPHRREKGSTTPTLSDLGITKDQSAAYQELAHPDVAEGVILDAIAEAGARGGTVTVNA